SGAPKFLPDAVIGKDYSFPFTASGDPQDLYFWQIAGGALPPGIDLIPNGSAPQGKLGSVQGTPTGGPNVYSFLIEVYPWDGGPGRAGRGDRKLVHDRRSGPPVRPGSGQHRPAAPAEPVPGVRFAGRRNQLRVAAQRRVLRRRHRPFDSGAGVRLAVRTALPE